MRRSLISAGTVVTAVTAASLLLAPAASASNKPNNNGDNGNVKIHDAKTGEELHKNEPHVCTFYLDGFKFDGAQQVTWHIEGHAPTADLKGIEGSLTLDGSGHERTADLSLADGHYKLYWNFDGENGKAKHKTFWVDCETEPGTETTQPGTETTKPGTETTKPGETPGTPGSSETPGATPSATDSAAAGQPAPSASGSSATGDLAETGSSAPVGAMAAVAVALAGAGAFLVMRRRKAQQH
ncbi:LPXTG cell wall anchor domain-containing protein [Streptomyces sp. ISL-36]|uniref:LPXTG cell wall anchor domain-containing protein n=1 Tax=Streptomyces sp. ISL-36 TaxID=2819182 RepID=UPI001BE96AE2|nr:LPXTG cell wall anchor domain-containing protein [Streptomyces sp. ISL-36]MBT2441937.1 LPXTG cell wall anchor domain-containing protein [Streptomyces sp. ISL-36]